MNFNAQPESMWLPPRHIERRATFDGSALFAIVRRLSISRLRWSFAAWRANQALGAGSFTEGVRSDPLQRVWRAIAEPAPVARTGIAKPSFLATLTKAAGVLMRVALCAILTTGLIVFGFGAVLVCSGVLVL